MQEFWLSIETTQFYLRGTSCTCCAKFTLQIDHNNFFLVCGIGDNQHTGHPPLLSNEIRNHKRFLDISTLETVAAMSVANIQPAQAALFTKTSTGQIFTRGQMAYVQGFTKTAKDLMASPLLKLMVLQHHLSLHPLTICRVIYKKWCLLHLSVSPWQNKRPLWEQCQGCTY